MFCAQCAPYEALPRAPGYLGRKEGGGEELWACEPCLRCLYSAYVWSNDHYANYIPGALNHETPGLRCLSHRTVPHP